MSKKTKNQKQLAHEAAQDRKARRAVAGVFIGLILVMLLLVIGYYCAFN